MAQKFGGKYSPDGQSDNVAPQAEVFQNARRSRAGGRVNLLFIAPLPLAWKAFTSDPVQMLQYLVALGLLLLAAWLTRSGQEAHDAYDARKVARRPAMPRKIFGSILTGAGLAVAGFASHGLIEAAIFALIGTALHFFAFGPDPLSNKGLDGVNLHQTDRVARAVDEAEDHLRAMSDAIKRAGDRALEGRVDRFSQAARALFRTVENDPRDLSAARRYLGVYLLGAKDATVKFADLYSRTRNPEARAEYEALLDDLEENFAARNQKLLLDDKGDLNIEIDVLRERLAREGVHHD
ncbi:MAG: 5-bromo-4-chloroindolyl phosphate hydrolysis family protein [Shimia sp.]|uniref:5-bromo-4-chloroindolyl phosphate hydrolysis family protein n=1 Tax=Shimia sp. TaxID=1954381 RepID=UPI004059995A